jgi:hypothetical protein
MQTKQKICKTFFGEMKYSFEMRFIISRLEFVLEVEAQSSRGLWLRFGYWSAS